MSNHHGKRSKFALALIIVGAGMAAGIFWALLFPGSSTTGGPSFKVENRAVTPSEAEVGEKIAVTVTVRNVGGGTGTYTLNPEVNGRSVASREAELEPGEVAEVTTYFSEREPGEYTITAAGENLEVHVYRVKPVQPREPLRYVYWRVKMPESSEENAPTTLQLDASAETGLKFEFYRFGGDNMTLLKESWLTGEKVEEGKRAELVLGRGTPGSVAVAVRILGPGENLLYREARTLEAGVIELTGFSLSESWKDNYRYRIRPRGKVTGDLPVFVKRVEVRVDGEKVNSETPPGRYVPRNPFPRVLIRPEIEKGVHTIKLTLFDEKGDRLASVENRKVIS